MDTRVGPRRRRRTWRLTVTVLALVWSAAACESVPLPAQLVSGPGTSRYVAMGDSWMSGPLIPDMQGSPLDCARSSQNAPNLIARGLRVREFVDASCGGAKLAHLTEAQKPALRGLLGTAAPQMDALTRDTTLVTIGIGGNDVKFPTVAIGCINLVPIELGPPPFGRPCRNELTADGADVLSERIAETRPRVVDALRQIRRRAPRAEVYVIGYPTALPQTGPGCWPRVPLLEADVRYLRAKYLEMNAMLRSAARAAGAHFVDTYRTSAGHDVCAPPGEHWVNALTLDPPALPLHPNAHSMRHTAEVVLDAIRRDR